MTDRRIFDAVVFGLAAHRVTRLVTKDTITRKLRDGFIWRAYGKPTIGKLESSHDLFPDGEDDLGPFTPTGGWSLYAEQDDDAPMLATLLVCRWCSSVHLMAGLLLFAAIAPTPARWLRYILAGSSVAVLLAGIEKP